MGWSRTEKLTLLGVVVAGISAYAAVLSIPERPQPAAPGDRRRDSVAAAPGPAHDTTVVAQRLREEQSAAERRRADQQRLLEMHEERVILRRERIYALARKLTTSTGGQYFSLSFSNGCTEDISFALAYLDLDGEWVTTGWWNVRPGTNSGLVAMTQNRIGFYYARSRSREWAGTDPARSLRRNIPKHRFTSLATEPNPYPKITSTWFRRFDIRGDVGEVPIKVTCG
ncbi:MAG TPA: DUF1036 domain-containing protein [Longimicrobium sp.]|nr:DUF1036 domain-containing protein [Longimicrobium sp.]